MKTIKIIIERSKDFYSAYADNVEGIFAAGNSPEEVNQSVNNAIRLLKENNSKENIPEVLKGEYKIEYHYDIASLLNYYKGIFSNSALERLTGINQKQLYHYSSGLKVPREPQRKKIESALHKLGFELLSIKL
jgi:predicted RNase H-like HicB family nuclease